MKRKNGRRKKVLIDPWYKLWKKYTVHPNLRTSFFEVIDTKEKAYWLGFLYADGFIERTQHSIRIHIELNRNDEDVINQFCDCLGLNKEKKRYRDRVGRGNTVEVRFNCKRMGNDLIKYGLVFRKSKVISYPRLSNRSLEVAFLLGYYDGDGRRHSTRISSGSIRFLEQIKNRFQLPYGMHLEATNGELADGRRIRGTKCYMCLGPGLFREMMQNYRHSMPRKRWFPRASEESARKSANTKARRKSSNGNHQ